jgi:hypothetical protein
VHAQAAPIDLSISTYPLNPDPGQQVTVTVQSYSADITQATISWSYNGKVIAANTGQTQINVIAPAAGGTGTLVVTVNGSGFETSTATLVLRPASLDLLWEGADSYTPPFYEGRALPSAGGIIRVTAVPSASAPSELTYAWTQNDSALQSDSGYEKSSILFRNSTLITTEHIDAVEENGGFTGENSVDITPGSPSLVGYLNNNGYIDYANGSTSSLAVSGTGALVHFEPYFFSASANIPKNLAFSYTDGSGNTIPAGDFENELPLSAPASGSESAFNVAVSTVAYSLQNLTVPFSVNFN